MLIFVMLGILKIKKVNNNNKLQRDKRSIHTLTISV